MTNLTYGDFITVDTESMCTFAPVLAEQMCQTLEAVQQDLPPNASIKLMWTAEVVPE